MPIQLEIAVQDVAGVQVALSGGADRVELCTGLEVGGLTPSSGAIEGAVEQARRLDVRGAVHVLIRPRAGGFDYGADDVAVMVRDIERARALGADGVVIGCLDAAGRVDEGVLGELVAASEGLEVTFHRALDAAPDPEGALEVLAAHGITRVLTSGGREHSILGVGMLRRLVAAAGGIQVMAGGGVAVGDIASLVATGVAAVHLSARRAVREVFVGPGGGEAERFVTDAAIVRAAAAALATASPPRRHALSRFRALRRSGWPMSSPDERAGGRPAPDAPPPALQHSEAQDVRIAVIGFGLRSSLASLAHRPGAGSRVTVVCDTAERGRRDAAAAIPGVTCVASLDELLGEHTESLDAVMVLTPDDLHVDHAVRTLEAGLATFVEKPLATTTEDADRILTTAHHTGTRVYIGHNMRHMPVVTTMRDVIASGTIGEVKAVWCRHFVSAGGDFYFKDWHAERARTTSLLLQKGAHDIDVIHWLAGGYSTTVSAIGTLAVYGGIGDRRDNSDRRMRDWYSTDNWPPDAARELNPVIDVEDLSMVNLVLDNGVLASYQQCHFTPDYWRNYTVIGTRGRLENLGDGPGGRVAVWTTRTDSFAEPDRVITLPASAGGHGGADPLLVAEFVRFAREGGTTATSPVAARQAVAAGVAATRSLRSGGNPVPVPPLDPALVDHFDAGRRGG